MAKKDEIVVKVDLGEKGGVLKFSEPTEVTNWVNAEIAKWQWLNPHQHAQGIYRLYQSFHVQVSQHAQSWTQLAATPDQAKAQADAIGTFLTTHFSSHNIWLSNSVTGSFILDVKERIGDLAGTGAYVLLSGTYTTVGQPPHPQFHEGIIEAYLFKNEVKWTATEHQKALERLKKQYAGNISHQEKILSELEAANTEINDKFKETLKERDDALAVLHNSQNEVFEKLTEEHKNNLESIESAYDQKLALQKPVEYWETRETEHRKKAETLSTVSVVIGILTLVLLGILASELFGDLGNKKPES